MRTKISDAIKLSNQPGQAGCPVPIPDMYTRREVRELMLITAIACWFFGLIFGYGWHMASTEQHRQRQAQEGSR